MKEIDLLKVISKLMAEYQSLYGKMNFNFKKVDNKFIITHVSPNILELVKLSQSDIVGKSLDELVNHKETGQELKQFFEKAWSGDEAFYYCAPPKNKEIFLFIILKPVIKEGEMAIGEGECFPLSQETFRKYNIESLDNFVLHNIFNH